MYLNTCRIRALIYDADKVLSKITIESSFVSFSVNKFHLLLLVYAFIIHKVYIKCSRKFIISFDRFSPVSLMHMTIVSIFQHHVQNHVQLQRIFSEINKENSKNIEKKKNNDILQYFANDDMLKGLGWKRWQKNHFLDIIVKYFKEIICVELWTHIDHCMYRVLLFYSILWTIL